MKDVEFVAVDSFDTENYMYQAYYLVQLRQNGR